MNARATSTTLPDWVHMLDAHAAKDIPAQSRTPEAVAARQAQYEREEQS